MASPFRYFRKHTKTFMAVAAVMCMFLFVFASGTGSGRNSDDDRRPMGTVATWNGGSLNEQQLSSLVYQRNVTNQFLRMLFVTGGGRSEHDLPQSVPNFILSTDRQDVIEGQVLNVEVYASLASAVGMTVSNDMINHYLKEFGSGRVTDDDIRGIMGQMADGNMQRNESIVFSTLRKLLLAHFYAHGFQNAGLVVLPEQRWEDWRRVNERISLQVASLPVETFLDEAPEPTEAQLKRLYDQYREAEPGTMHQVVYQELPAPTPGFAEPRRVTVQFLEGNLAERTEKLLSTITDAEIEDYYERNKRKEFVKIDFDSPADFDNETPPSRDEGAEPSPADPADGADPADTSDSTADEPAVETAPAEEPPAEAPAPDAAPASDSPADAVQSSDAEATDNPTADSSAEPAAEGGAAEPAAGDQSSRSRRRSPFQLAALQTATDEDGATAPEADPVAADEDVPTAEPSDDAAEAPADAAAPGGEQTTTEGAAEDAAVPAADSPSGDAPAGDAPAAGAAGTEPPVQYIPLDEVRDEIRHTLARDKAGEELQQQVGEALAKLLAEYNQYGRLAVENRAEEKAPPPAPEKLKDLKWLADEYGLTIQKFEPLTDRELFDTAVGKAVDEQSGRINVTQAAFLSLELHEPLLAKELDGSWYLVMKTADVEKRIPPFAEVRDKVAAAWKRLEASKLAMKKAEELANASETASESFEEFFKGQGYEVVPQTALFSWRSYPLGPGLGDPPALSKVPELKNVGPDFMDVAFSLKDGETKAVLNYDNSVAYVIRLHSRQYTPEELRKLFVKETNTWAGNGDALSERFQGFRSLLDNQISEKIAGLKIDEEWLQRRREQLAERN